MSIQNIPVSNYNADVWIIGINGILKDVVLLTV